MFRSAPDGQGPRAGLRLAPILLAVAACTGVATTPTGPADSPATAAIVPTPVASADIASAPATTPSPSGATVVCEQETTGCAGPLTTGEHHTAAFDHPFTFTIPDTGHWSNVIDKARSYHFRVDAAPNAEFNIWSQAAPEAQADCDAREREPGYGNTTAEWLRYLSEHTSVDVLSTEAFVVDGRQATRVEVGVKPSWTRTCPGNTDPFAFLVTDTGNPPTRGHGIATGGPASMSFIDVGDEAIVIWNDGGDVPMSQMVDLALPVIRSIHFETSK